MLLKFIENIKENVKSFPETKIILILKKTHFKKKQIIYLSWNISKIEHIRKSNCVIYIIELRKKNTLTISIDVEGVLDKI